MPARKPKLKVVYEDDVGWEPLEIRYRIQGTPTTERCNALADFVINWMRERERASPEDWHFCEYSATVMPSGTVEVLCELMPPKEVEPLASAIESAFDFVAEMRLGNPVDGSPSLKKMDWFDVSGRNVEIDGQTFSVNSFTISFTAITVGQFCEFLDATGWVPWPDRLEDNPGYAVSHFTLNFGPSPKIPFFGLTYDDAVAFCEWSGYRLPTDPELRLFYETVANLTERAVQWDGENWTSTPAGEDQFYVRQGPFAGRPANAKDQYRKPLHRHHYEFLEAPSFRIVKQ